MYTLYQAEGPYRGYQNLLPIATQEAGNFLLDELFRLVREGKSVTIIKEPDDDKALMAVTIRNSYHDRQYMVEIISELAGSISIHRKGEK